MHHLIVKYLNHTASAEEVRLVDEWYQSMDEKEGLTQQLTEVEKEVLMKNSFAAIKKALQ